MENALLLAAVCLSAFIVLLCLISKGQKYANIIKILWGLVVTFIIIDMGMLIYYLITRNFSYCYVYNHTDNSLDLVYRISALWSGQEGSFLLWGACLAVIGIFVLFEKGKNSKRVFGAYVLICLSIFIACYISKPFARMDTTPLNGIGMAQALKDPWMVVHPPLIFIAYSLMAVLAVQSVALPKESEKSMIERIQKWVRLSWVFLGLGIFTGSIWAYRALGWGGYWSWDPIENTALVPWLIMCGYMHIKDKISISKCVLPFIIACFGTFLTRSGILNERSAHAYTQGNILISVIILGLIFCAACWIALSKFKDIQKNKTRNITGFFKDTKQVFCHIINFYALLIFLGTMAPLITGVNTPIKFYMIISIIFSLLYVTLLLMRDIKTLSKKNLWMMAISTIIVIAVAFISETTNYAGLLFMWACLMPPSLWIASRFKSQNWRYYLLHIGMILMIVGITTSSYLGKDSYVISQLSNTSFSISGNNIATSDIMKQSSITASSLTCDVIIDCSKAISMQNGSIRIPYTTKPLIILFWIGGFLTILSPCFMGIKKKIIK